MIRIEHIQKTYDRHTAHANHVLQDISLTLPDTGFICILGPSGCGKTTLMNVIGGLDSFDSGTITVNDVSAKRYGVKVMEEERNRSFGYIFQNYYLLGERSVTYNVYLGLHAAELGRLEKLKRVKAALQAVGMDGYARKNVKDLSGGQQQRVAIARALVRKPQVIFADEPTGNLDEINTDMVCRLLRDLSATCLVVMVTHEERIAEEYADRVIMLDQGKIVSDRENVPVQTADTKLSAPEEEKADRESLREDASPDGRAAGKKAGGEPVWKTILAETKALLTIKGKRTGTLRACLAVLTALLVLMVGDYLTLSTINPEDFITSDSHLIELEAMRGGYVVGNISDSFLKYLDYLDECELDMTYVPLFNSMATYNYDSFWQMNTLKEKLFGFSFVPLDKLSDETLIYGQMPQKVDEVVVDRWVLDNMVGKGGILQAGISDLTHFLGKQITLDKKNIELTISGICDSGEPSVYADKHLLLSISAGGSKVMTLDQFKTMFPGKYDDITLEEGEVLTGPAAGVTKAGNKYSVGSDIQYTVKEVIPEDFYAQFVVKDDSQYDSLLRYAMSRICKIVIYTEDKEAVKEYATNLPEDMAHVIQIKLTDDHTTAMNSYRAAMRKRVNARTIVTATVLLTAAVMLFFLLKARTEGRKEMLGVYRLLGISTGRTLSVFALESLFLSVTGALPAAIVVWAVIRGLTLMPSIAFSMVLPLSAALLAYVAALAFHLAVSLLPAARLLHLPPAVLAGRYDF